MTAEQREKIAHAIQALIDVESALKQTDSARQGSRHWGEVEEKLSAARNALVELNAPDYS